MKKKAGGFSTDTPDRLNVIVDGSRLKGDFTAESNLRIDGHVDGNVTCSSKVVIGPDGTINGNLMCAGADVEGKIEGQLKVEGLLSLRSSAKIMGEITTSRIQIEEGAQFTGECKMSNRPTSNSSSITSSAPRETEENVIY